jgi:hypothetical protein
MRNNKAPGDRKGRSLDKSGTYYARIVKTLPTASVVAGLAPARLHEKKVRTPLSSPGREGGIHA